MSRRPARWPPSPGQAPVTSWCLFPQRPFDSIWAIGSSIPKKNRMTEGEDRYLLRFVVEDTRTFILEGAVAVTALSVLPQFMTVENY